MAKREYIQANKDWLEAKAKEQGVKALPKGIYYKVLSEGNQDSATPTVRSIIFAARHSWRLNTYIRDRTFGHCIMHYNLIHNENE